MFLKIENVSFRYENSKDFALTNVSFEVNDGDKIGVVGPAGAGKSTLFYLLCGLYKPSSGKILFKNIEVVPENKNHKKLRTVSGLVMQFPEKQIFESTIYDEISFGPRNFGFTKEEIDIKVKQSLNMIGLDYDMFSSKSPLRISMGEKRKVAIASILALEPQIILFDEPTVALDYFGFKEIERCISRLNENNKTILTISHDIEFLSNNFDRILGFKNGRLIIDAEIADVFSNNEVMKELELKI